MSAAHRAMMLLVIVLAGCASPSSPTPPHATATPAASAPPSPSATPAATPAASQFDAARVTVTAEPMIAIPGNPLAVVTAADGTGRLFVVDKGRKVRIVANRAALAAPFLDN